MDDLILVKRKEVIQRIKVARGYGDLSENSEYEAAKEEQAILENEIERLTEQLRTAEVIDPSTFASDLVSIGKRVELHMSDTGTDETYEFVGRSFVDVFNHKISIDCPLGCAVNGLRVNDFAQVVCPDGTYQVMVKHIQTAS